MLCFLSDYYQGPVGLPRASGGVTGAPGPGGLAGTASQPVMTGGPPPAQLGQPGGPVALGIVQGPGGVVGVGGLASDSTTGPTTTPATTGKQTRRKYAIDIIDPKTMKNVDIYEGSVTSSSTPPRSGESSARDTPQPVGSLLNTFQKLFILCLWECTGSSVSNFKKLLLKSIKY
jgi:hypothetical protein